MSGGRSFLGVAHLPGKHHEWTVMGNYANLLYVYILLKNLGAAWAPGCTLGGMDCSSGLAAAWGFWEKGVLPFSSLTEPGAWGSQEANLWKEEGPYIQDSVILDIDFTELRNEEQHGKEWEQTRKWKINLQDLKSNYLSHALFRETYDFIFF